MKWFKHLADSHNDPDLNVARDKFGDMAVAVFWITMEIYAKEFEHLNENNDGFIRVSFTDFKRKLRKSSTKVKKLLNFFQEKNRINYKIDGDYILLNIPKFIELADEYTIKRAYKKDKKIGTLSGHTPKKTPIEVEVEVEVDKEIYKESVSKSPFLKRQDIFFEGLWKRYPNRLGKKSAKRHFKASVKTAENYYACKEALKNYIKYIKVKGLEPQFIQNGSTWFNNWQDWTNYQEPIIKKSNIA